MFAENAQKNLIKENEQLRSQLKELYERITPKVNNERKIPNKYFNLEGRLDLESVDKISWEDYEKEELIRVIVKNIEKVKVIEQNGKRRERQYQSVMSGYERAIQRINNNEQNILPKETERVTQLIEQNNELEKQLTQITQNYRNLELNYQYEWILNEQQMLEKVIIQERLTKTQGMLLQTRKMIKRLKDEKKNYIKETKVKEEEYINLLKLEGQEYDGLLAEKGLLELELLTYRRIDEMDIDNVNYEKEIEELDKLLNINEICEDTNF